uniref:Putative 50 kDa protein in type I retrotransposable element R1DM n=1 Tax=Ceratitis capitata TaxID=7213 RepID=W8B8E6_CERCA
MSVPRSPLPGRLSITAPSGDVRNDSESGPSPFDRSTKIARSPTRTRVSSPCNRPQTESDAWNLLGIKIKDLVGMLEDGKRRSINQPMRDIIAELPMLYAKIQHPQAQDGKRVGTQTTPQEKRVTDKNITQTVNIGIQTRDPRGKSASKRPATTTKASEEKQPTNDKRDDEVSANKWKLVQRKQKLSKIARKTVKPDAIVISKTGAITYADILRQMKQQPDMKELGENVNKIKTTASGNLLVQLRDKTGKLASKFKERAAELLKTDASVTVLSSSLTVEIRDIDMATTAEDVSKALKDQFPKLNIGEDVILKSLRKTRSGTHTATLNLPVRDAQSLVETGRIRIGWVSCRVREVTHPTRCYRCLEFGHMSRNCKSAVDRSGMCLRCGEKGHIAKLCNATPKCVICKKETGTDHPTGSFRCPTYKKAITHLKQ